MPTHRALVRRSVAWELIRRNRASGWREQGCAAFAGLRNPAFVLRCIDGRASAFRTPTRLGVGFVHQPTGGRRHLSVLRDGQPRWWGHFHLGTRNWRRLMDRLAEQLCVPCFAGTAALSSSFQCSDDASSRVSSPVSCATILRLNEATSLAAFSFANRSFSLCCLFCSVSSRSHPFSLSCFSLSLCFSFSRFLIATRSRSRSLVPLSSLAFAIGLILLHGLQRHRLVLFFCYKIHPAGVLQVVVFAVKGEDTRVPGFSATPAEGCGEFLT